MRKAILVLGMHRSGTSALTGALGLLGARLPAQQLSPQSDNPKGFFESARITSIHDRIFGAAGTNWLGLDRIPAEWLRSAHAEAFVNEIVDAIREDFGDATLFVVKDPRMCRLIPIWDEVLGRVGAQMHFAITLRNPLEVAYSLKRRDSIPPAYGFLMWLEHMLEAEIQTRGARRVFENFADLLDHPTRTAEYVIAQLGIDELAVNKNSASQIESFIDPSLRHHFFGVEDLKSTVAYHPWLSKTYRALAKLARDPNDEVAQQWLDDVRLFFDPVMANFALLFARGEKLLANLQVNSGPLNQRIDWLDEFDRVLAKQWIYAEKLQAADEKRQEQIGLLKSLLAERNARIATLSQENAEREMTIQKLYASTSWRISRPLRIVRQLIDRAKNIKNLSVCLLAAAAGAPFEGFGVYPFF
jgi:hypothetical protein